MTAEKLLVKKHKNKARPLYTVIFCILLLYVISIFLPVLWGVITSLKDQTDFRVNVLGLPEGWPWEWHWDNFIKVFNGFYEQVTTVGVGRRRVYFSEMLLYTILYAGGGAIIQTLVPCVVAYLTARFRYKFSAVINGLVVVLMVVPIVGSAPSEMQILRALNMYDTIWATIFRSSTFWGCTISSFMPHSAAYRTTFSRRRMWTAHRKCASWYPSGCRWCATSSARCS